MNIDQILEAINLGEDQDVEFKSAEGGLPKSLWETVSAFANTDGGFIVLGVSEHDGRFVVSGARTAGTRYRWPKGGMGDLFERGAGESGSSEHLTASSEHSESEQTEKLLALAAPVREKPKVAKWLAEETILALCSEDWRTIRTLAGLLGRDADSLRNHYINPMLRDGRLIARVPGKPNHPNQAYKKKPE